MRTGGAKVALAVGMMCLMFLSTVPLSNPPPLAVDGADVAETTPVGQATKITIGSWPDGANQRVELSVPDGHAIKSIDLGLEPSTLPQSVATSLTDAGDFDVNPVYDGMDVNTSTLGILPSGAFWDFEDPLHGWTLGGTNVWMVGFDTTIGSTNGVSSGSNALYTYNGNYPNYMSQFWATSPTIDCSGCTGAWSLNYMRRLGVESSSWDHAYVQVKNPSGSWVNIWSNSGTMNEASFTQVSHTISNYIAGNSAFAVRFGLGTSDGSVTYTGWNIDDVAIEPTGGSSGNGEGNWTSDPFGPSLVGRGEEASHGLLHMDHVEFPGSVFEYQILDALTGTPIVGFERLSEPSIDLGMIDAQVHPLLRMKVHMKEAPGGGAPEIRSLSFDGHVAKSFDTDPSSEGWQIQGGSWANGAITSSGRVLSESYQLRSGFSAIVTNSTQSGPGLLEFTTDGGQTWSAIDAQGRVDLAAPAFSIQFRMDSTGGTYTWQSFEAEMVRTSVPVGLRLDVGIDGTSEWSLDKDAFGPLGLQDRLVNGDRWTERPIAPATTASMEVALPTRGVDAFSFVVASPSTVIANPFLAMAVNGQDILSRNLANIDALTSVDLTDSELQTLNDALSQATNTFGVDELPMATVEVRVGSSLSTSTLVFGGLFAPYDADMNFSLNAASPLVIGLNTALSDVVPSAGHRTIHLPVRMDGTGSVYLTLNQLETQASVEALAMTVANVSDTLVPGNDWIETGSTFDFSPLGVTDALTHARQSNWEAELRLVGESQQSSLRCPVASFPITPQSLSSCTASGTALLWSDEGLSGSVSAVGSGPYLEVRHHFKFPDGWNDEPSAVLSVHMISPSGPMLPVTTVFGLGHDQGVENDLEVVEWGVEFDDGIMSDPAFPYLQSGKLVTVKVALGFEGVDESTPRSGQALVRFLVDGNEYATTTAFVDGVASFPWNVPTGRPSIDLGVEVVPLRGQDVVSDLSMSHTFLFDNVAPSLVSSSVERFDNRDVAPINELSFLVADRPNLPTHARAHVWHSWQNDANGNGVFDLGEHVSVDLGVPENLTNLVGAYVLEVDTSQAHQGDYFLGWLEIADSAGHVMPDAGSPSSPMFHVQLNSNGAPSLGATSLGWPNGETQPWFHPGEENQIRVPVWEQNGIFDLAEVHLALASNKAQPALVSWNQSTNQCTSSDVYVEIESCELVPSEADDLFSRNGEFVVNFTLEWGYDPDTSAVRIPQLTMKDQSGQTNMFTLEPLGWRFSGELAIDGESLQVHLEGEEPGSLGFWIQPRTSFGLSGDVVWFRTGEVPQQDLEVELQLGENTIELQAINGSFNGTMLAPLKDGTYGLFGDLFDAPNGAVYRGGESAFVWFIVDNEAPRVTAVDQPGFNNVLTEEMWRDLSFELRLAENARLDESSLRLHWSLNEAGLGLSSYTFDNGSLPLTVMGERLSGASIPVQCTLDLDSVMLPVFRTRSVELRIWVTGEDEAGQSIDAIFNDVDAPLRVWALEQRIPMFSVSDLEFNPKSDLRKGDMVEVAAVISNQGLADGEASMVLELVESSGARTRLDARTMNVQSNEQVLYQYLWKPGREGTQWLELSIINGPNAQSPTVFIDEERSEGVLGSIGSVNPLMLSVVGILVIGLVALLLFGLRREATPTVPLAAPSPAKTVAELPPQPPSEGPYGGQQVASPGENPYQ